MVVSRDYFRHMFGEMTLNKKDEIKETIVTELMTSALSILSKRNLNIIIDNTNLLQSYIDNIAQTVGYSNVQFRVMDVDKMTCIERNKKREAILMVPENVIGRQFQQFQSLLRTDFQTRKYNEKIKEKIENLSEDVLGIKTELPNAYIFDLDGKRSLKRVVVLHLAY